MADPTTKWNKVFKKDPESVYDQDYVVHKSWHRRVLKICKAEAIEESLYTETNYHGKFEVNSYRLLDGFCWGTGESVNLSGQKLFRFLIYKLDIEQPRKFPDEDHVPSLGELGEYAQQVKSGLVGEIRLKEATQANDLKAMQDLINQGANINAGNGFNETPLVIAIENQYKDAMKLLLEKGADPFLSVYRFEKLRGSSQDPFTYVTYSENSSLIDLFLKMYSDISGEDVVLDNNTEVIFNQIKMKEAIRDSDIEKVNQILIDPLFGVDSDTTLPTGFYPLEDAVRSGHVVIVQLLLDAGVSQFNAKDHTQTLLFLAIEQGYIEIAESLIRAGFFRDSTVLAVAKARGYYSIIRLLQEAGMEGIDVEEVPFGNFQDLWNAVDDLYVGQIRTLLAQGINVNQELDGNLHNVFGSTVLMRACAKRNYEIVKVLVENGAEVNAQDKFGITALMWAIMQTAEAVFKTWMRSYDKDELCKIVKLLIDSGANLSLEDTSGKTALDYTQYFEFEGVDIIVAQINESSS